MAEEPTRGSYAIKYVCMYVCMVSRAYIQKMVFVLHFQFRDWANSFFRFLKRSRIAQSQFRESYSLSRIGDILHHFVYFAGGDTGQSFIWGGPAGRSNPLPFYMSFSAERYPVSVPSIDTYHFHIPGAAATHTQFRTLHSF